MNRSKLIPLAVVLVLATLAGILFYGTKKDQPKVSKFSQMLGATFKVYNTLT